jgi:ribA/ribD-fused uncharacterized protein
MNMVAPVNFWEGKYYLLSNFSAHEVEYLGVRFKTAEHAYQVAKFEGETQRERIAQAPSAFLAREYGQELEGRATDFDKVGVMKAIMRAKLEQHVDVRAALLETGGADIRKNHPEDDYWGTGSDGDGQNVMGKIWMELRDELK